MILKDLAQLIPMK